MHIREFDTDLILPLIGLGWITLGQDFPGTLWIGFTSGRMTITLILISHS